MAHPVRVTAHLQSQPTTCHTLQVLELRDILRYDVESSVTERMRLEEFALKCLTYTIAEGCTEEDIEEKYRFYTTEEYKVLQLTSCLAMSQSWFI